jgi:NAD(P)-dependent dehydrogenase (short-subunit alcohol dehydrogenase family)
VGEQTTRVCIVGASGKLGQYLVQHSLDRGYEVVGVCREQSVPKLDAFNGCMTTVPGATDDPEVIKRAVAGCLGVLVVLVPRLPVWSRHVGDPILESNLTRRVDFALFMVEALKNDELVHEAPAIVGRLAPSALAHANSPAG